MEDFGARDAAPADLCRQKVTECDIFVGIVGPRYGSCPPDADVSFTELECDTAAKKGMPRLLFVTADDFPVPSNIRESDETHKKLEAFRRRTLDYRGTAFFSSEQDLATKVVSALHNLQPWPSGFQAYCVPVFARPEGHTEKLGDVQITAYGSPRPYQVDITLTLMTHVTNRIDIATMCVDVALSSERQGRLNQGRLVATNQIVFEAVRLDQADLLGDEVLTISGVRASARGLDPRYVKGLLEITDRTVENRILFSTPLVLAMIPGKIAFSAERARNDIAVHVGTSPGDARVRSFSIVFAGSFPGAFKTREEEATPGCHLADHGTVLYIYPGILPHAVRSAFRLFATVRDLPAPGAGTAESAERAALVRTDFGGSPGPRLDAPARLLWEGRTPMVEVEQAGAAWEVVRTVPDSATLRFGFSIVGPERTDQVWLRPHGGFAPFYSLAAAHHASGTLPIPRFVTMQIRDDGDLTLD